MASKREQVIAAVLALVQAALPNAKVLRNRDKPNTIDPGGTAIVRDGDPGDPEVDLSPLTYNYAHRIPVEIAGYEAADRSREAVLDELLAALGEAVEADRQLGGLCQFVEVEAAAPDDLELYGAASARWVEAVIVAQYATPKPLG